MAGSKGAAVSRAVGWSLLPILLVALGCSSVGPRAAGPAGEGDPAAPVSASPDPDDGPPLQTGPPKPRPEPAAIVWETHVPTAIERARREDRALLVFLRAGWSVPSREMARDVWTDPRVRRAVRSVIPLEVDVTEASAEDDELVARLGVEGVPAVILLDPAAQPLGQVTGGSDADAVLALLAQALSR